MTTKQSNAGPPQPFQVGDTLFARVPGVGLCRMGSWGWEPHPADALAPTEPRKEKIHE